MMAARRALAYLGSSLGLALAGGIAPANAYNGDAAVSYANTWWNAHNSTYPQFSDDCTNFISQALHAGGINYRPADFGWSGDYATSTYWIAQSGLIDYWTTTWSVARDSHAWTRDNIAGTTETEPKKTGVTHPSGYHKGDLVYYDWDDDGHSNHAAMIVGAGADTGDSNYNGTLVDEHTDNRRRVIWTLAPYNSQWATTEYFLVHIADTAS